MYTIGLMYCSKPIKIDQQCSFHTISERISTDKLMVINIRLVVVRNGVAVFMVFNRDVYFIFTCQRKFHEKLGTQLHFSIAYHPQTKGQSKQTIQTLEDILWACVLDSNGSWDTYLPLVEFSYNNSYHDYIDRRPFEMLYRRRCRTLVCWAEVRHL